MATISAASDTRDRLKRLPAFPPVAAKLLSLLSNPAADLNRIADLASGDATICGRLLQRANSAEFARAAPSTSLLDALQTLGLDRSRELTASVAAACYVQSARRTEQLRRSWMHMAATAIIADEIARTCEAHVEAAYTAGLLHDIGRLGLLVAYPEEYERMLSGAAARCLDVLDFESETFGANHAEIGLWLAERWNLPEEFRVVAGRHHDSCLGPDLDLLRIVHVACSLADHFGYDVTEPLQPHSYHKIVAGLPQPQRNRLQRTGAREALAARLGARIDELGDASKLAEPVSADEQADAADPEVETLVSGLVQSDENPPAPSAAARVAVAAAILLVMLLCLLWSMR